MTHCIVVSAEHEVPAKSRQLNKDIKTNVGVKQQPHVDSDHSMTATTGVLKINLINEF